jgi:Bax protein
MNMRRFSARFLVHVRGTGFESIALGVLLSSVLGLFLIADAGSPRLASEAAVSAGSGHPAHAASRFSPRLDYRLEAVRRGEREVPRLFLASLPRDLAGLRAGAERKSAFLKVALPLVLKTNEALLERRARIIRLQQRRVHGSALSRGDRRWLDRMVKRYRLKHLDFEALLRRVDIVPPSLALAQAIEESGWGTSRFAREGNALFGQWTFKGEKGMRPLERRDDARHSVRSFDELSEAVHAYAHNLNTHPAYRRFRARRAELRRRDAPLDGFDLAGTLAGYSERRGAYVEALRGLIRHNGLGQFDAARLSGSADGSESGI